MLVALVAVALAVAACARSCSARRDRRLNILLISIDSLRADHLDCYGYRSATGAPTSPVLDRFAKEGVLFENVVSSTTWTMPSHHALFTGLPDLAHGAVHDNNGVTPQHVDLGAALSDAGYATAGFYSGPYLAPHYGFGESFGSWTNASGVEEGINARLTELVEKLKADSSLSQEQRRELLSNGIVALVEDGYHKAETADKVSNAAIAWLEGRKSQADPFFLFVHYFDVHFDYVPPEERYSARFWPGNVRPRLNGENFFTNDQIHAGMSRDDLAGVISCYDGEILWVDEQVGRLLKRVDDLGLRDDTLVVVVSDHGDEFFEHGVKGHRQNLFQPTTNVVTMLRLPDRLPAGRRVASRVSLVDVAPTILALAGAEQAADARAPAIWNGGRDLGLLHGMWGRSLLPLVTGEETRDRDCLAFLTERWRDPEHPTDYWALWTGSMKVLLTKRYERRHASNGEPLLVTVERRGQVFDLASDPGESRDLSTSNSPAIEAAIARFDERFGPGSALARLGEACDAGPTPPPLTPEQREVLNKLGYLQGQGDPKPLPRGTKLKDLLPPPPTFPRAR